MKKITKKEAFMGVLVGGLVVILLVYLMVFSKFNEKTTELVAQNNNLRTEVESIRGYYENKAQYEQGKQDMEEAIQAMIEEYPADVREEDAVMLAVDMQENATISYYSINLPTPEEVYVVSQEDVTPANIEGLDSDIAFNERKSIYACAIDYDNLKACIERIYANPNRIAIEDISLLRTEVVEEDVFYSNLEGNIGLSFYSMTGTGKEYTAPDMAAYVSGTSNPFKLVSFGMEGAGNASAATEGE